MIIAMKDTLNQPGMRTSDGLGQREPAHIEAREIRDGQKAGPAPADDSRTDRAKIPGGGRRPAQNAAGECNPRGRPIVRGQTQARQARSSRPQRLSRTRFYSSQYLIRSGHRARRWWRAEFRPREMRPPRRVRLELRATIAGQSRTHQHRLPRRHRWPALGGKLTVRRLNFS